MRKWLGLSLVLSIGCSATANKPPLDLQVVTPPPSKRAPVVEAVDPERRLLVEGRATYDIENQLRRFDPLASPDKINPISIFFGSKDKYLIRDQVEGVHRRIHPLVLEEINASPVVHARWAEPLRLVFDVVRLDFFTNADADWKQGVCILQLLVHIQSQASGQVVFKLDESLIIREAKEQPGGRQTLDSVHRKAAAAVVEVLAEYWRSEM